MSIGFFFYFFTPFYSFFRLEQRAGDKQFHPRDHQDQGYTPVLRTPSFAPPVRGLRRFGQGCANRPRIGSGWGSRAGAAPARSQSFGVGTDGASPSAFNFSHRHSTRCWLKVRSGSLWHLFRSQNTTPDGRSISILNIVPPRVHVLSPSLLPPDTGNSHTDDSLPCRALALCVLGED